MVVGVGGRSLHLIEHVGDAALSRRAFLISSAVTYGYSPYFRKLGTW
jgi:hypothetical protein